MIKTPNRCDDAPAAGGLYGGELILALDPPALSSALDMKQVTTDIVITLSEAQPLEQAGNAVQCDAGSMSGRARGTMPGGAFADAAGGSQRRGRHQPFVRR